MRPVKKKSIFPLKKIVLISLVLLCALSGGTFIVWKMRDSTSSDASSIGDRKESEAGRKQADDQKHNTPDTPAAPADPKGPQPANNTPPPLPSVTPIVTYAGYQDQSKQAVEVDAFIPGIFETGTCTLTLTQGSQKITRTSAAQGEATTTSCSKFIVERGVFPVSGIWNAVVSYSSPGHNGQSAVTTFNIE